MISTDGLLEKPVYTEKGILVGNVYDVILDFETGNVYGLLIKDTNMKVVGEGIPISIPFRWIKSIGDAILLLTFPEKVNLNRREQN
ncbi:MAG: PRC-barrel domain-containing protein [Candidatus Thermoplasmatota archaeon]|nr:PRC-barrel domain-containing protein [Candidatus Thermoplasmatota archaeon]